MNKKNFVAALACIMLSFTLYGCLGDEAPPAADRVKSPVKTLLVEETSTPDIVNYVGLLKADQLVSLSFKAQGRLLRLNVEEGDFVKASDVLATLEPLDLDYALAATQTDVDGARAQLAKAKDALEFAENTARDIKSLYEQEAVSRQSYDKSVLDLNLAQSDYAGALELLRQAGIAKNQMESMRSEAVLYAPFDGQIVSVMAQEGELTSPAYPILAIANDSKMVTVGVSQKDVQRIRPGMTSEIRMGDLTLAGVVQSVTNVPDMETRTYQVSISVEASSIPVGAVGDVRIIVGEKRGISIPINSILSNTIDYVFVIDEGLAHKRIVELGAIDRTRVFVDGLSPGDELVVEGMSNLENLDKVMIIEE